MSDHLPDDPRRWPSDPFLLLGVPRNVQPRDLKRAYTRLIRTFKPEHAPEEFRRIREAYDSVRQFAELYSRFQQHAEEPSEEQQAVSADSSPADDTSAGSTPAARVVSLEEQLEECWRWAVDGDELKAYHALKELHAQSPHDPRINARLYWLLTIAREIDAHRSPCDWLVAGLKRNGFSGPLRELYRRELAANAAEASSDRCRELLEALPVTHALADLVEWRWNAISQSDNFVALLLGDLLKLRERFLGHDEETWVRLVLFAVDRLVFVDGTEAATLRARCHRDLETLGHLQLRLSAAFDRYELAQDLGEKRRALLQEPAAHAEFLDLVRDSWLMSIEQLQPRLMSYLANIAARPGMALKNFDAIHGRASPLLFQFRRALSSLEQIAEPAADTRKPEEINELVLSFAYQTPASTYTEWRPQLLDFCLREVVMPEQFAAALSGYSEFQLTSDQHLSQAASADLPLVCVCHACRLFWA